MRSPGRLFAKLTLITVAVAASRAVLACPTSVSFSSRGETAEELLVQLFKRSGDSFLIEPCDSCDRRISVRLSGAPLELALKRICESADLTWTKRDKVYVITPNRHTFALPRAMHVGPLTMSSSLNIPGIALQQPLSVQQYMPRMVLVPGIPELSTFLTQRGSFAFNDGKWFYGAVAAEDRSTFMCPHCKRSVTIVSKSNTCAKCSRSFQRDWAFCPFDGARRTAPLDDWKACPFCTRGVK